MKKLITLLILLVLSVATRATITFTLVHAPCDTNGILVANISTAYALPYTIQYSSCSKSITHIVTSTVLTDTIFNYNGAPLTVNLYDSTSGFIDSGSYGGAMPFGFGFTTTMATCPAWSTITCSLSTTTGPLPTGPITYHWYNSTTGVSLSATTASITASNGTYGIWITDTAGCGTGSAVTCGYIIDTNISPFNIDSISTTPANCTNGKAKITGITGTAALPLNYLWSNGATTDSISGLSMGSYGVTVTDALGCRAIGYGYVNQSIYVYANATPTPASCLNSDGSIIAFGSGGVPPYTYSWSNGATTQNITGLAAGYYNVNVTDSNGCLGSGSAYVSSSTPITVTYSAAPSSCTAPTGSASLTISGGTAPYRDTFYCTPIQTGPIASSLASGIYDFHVVDNVGCVQNGSVYVPPIDVLSASFSETPALCTLATGGLTMSVSGGILPLTYSWSIGSVTNSISGVPAGTYPVTVTDVNGCSITKYPVVSNYSPLSVASSTTDASCIFTADGAASVAVFGGTVPYTYSWSNGGTSTTITSLATGPYWTYITDANGCTAWNYDWVNYNLTDSSCFCVIKGNVYFDINHNLVRDAGEPGIPNIQMFCSGIGYTYTDDSGNYYFIVPAGSYTVNETIGAYYPLTFGETNYKTATITTTGSGCSNIINFSDNVDTLHDMQITVWDWTWPVPGNTYSQTIVVHNNGTVTENNIKAGYKTDGQLFGASFVPSGVFSALGTTYDYNSLIDSFPALAPGATQIFLVNYNVPTTIPLGTNVLFKDSTTWSAPLSAWVADYTPWDNVNYWNAIVVGSFDPNFKEVNPKGVGSNGTIPLADTNFEYMVHFQNTGTAPAQNIVVIDTLDANLDWSTLQPVNATGNCRITMSTNGIVKFTFPNINLPTKSSNPVGSNGMLSYNIKAKHGAIIGEQIKNSASIYFDYNAPIKTNTTVNTYGWTASVPTTFEPNNFFEIYPNPAQNNFTASITADRNVNDAQLLISDITGKTILVKTMALIEGKQNIGIDASNLASGLYFIIINQDGKTQTQKLVIVK